MVLFFQCNAIDPPVTIYMGRDKEENEDLIRYAYTEDIWFHVDKLSSAHVYLRLPNGMSWEAIPESVLVECAQLVKANSIEGNKKDNITVIYTPSSNLKKTGDMAVGQVSFHKDKMVRRVYIATRDNSIVNRLNKTKVVREVDHEGDKAAREREAGRLRKLEANERKKQELELARQRKELADAKNYVSLRAAQEQERKEKLAAKFADEAAKSTRNEEDYDSDDDFM